MAQAWVNGAGAGADLMHPLLCIHSAHYFSSICTVVGKD